MALKDMFDEIREKNEKQLTQLFVDLMQSKRFTSSVVKAFELSTEARNSIDENAQELVRALNLPTREDHEQLTEKVKNLTKKISDLDTKLIQLGKKIDQAAGPAA